MTRVHSKSSRVLVNTQHLSGSITGWKMSSTREFGRVTTILDEGGRFIPGLFSGSVGIRGLFNSSAGDLHETITAAVGVDNSLLVTVLPDGLTVGQPALMALSDVTGYDIPATVSDAVALNVDAMPDELVDMGVSLHALTEETADGNSTTVDNAIASTNGACAHLHVTAYATLTSNVVTVQHSVDDSVWVDLLTFATSTALTSERKAVTGTVNRYVRALWDVTGSGSTTFVVAFARR